MEPFLNVIIDLAIAALLLFFMVRGAKKGFVMTIAGLVALILAIAGAGLLAKYASPFVADMIRPGIYDTIHSGLWSEVDGTVVMMGDISVFGVSVASTGVFDAASAAAQGTVEVVAAALADQIASTAAHVIVAVISFLALLITLHIIMHVIDLAMKLPVLSTLNLFGGLVAGTAKGLIFIWLLVWVLQTFTGVVPPEVRSNTILYDFFAGISPLAGF